MAESRANLTEDQMVTETIQSIISGVSQMGHRIRWREANGETMDMEQTKVIISNPKIMNIIRDLGFETFLYYVYLDKIAEHVYYYLAGSHGTRSAVGGAHRFETDCSLYEFDEATMIYVYQKSQEALSRARVWKQVSLLKKPLSQENITTPTRQNNVNIKGSIDTKHKT